MEVIRRKEESAEALINRFSRKVQESGILSEMRRKDFYEKPSDKKRRKRRRRK